MGIDKDKKILIVGLGLIGGSYAKALTEKGYFVGGLDTDSSAICYAKKNGIINCGETNPTEDFIGKFDLIVFSVYPHTILEWTKKYQHLIKKNALITDVTGIKTCFVHKLQEILRDDLEFIGAHPMAGRESSGIENADPKIFLGANYIVTPTKKNTENAITACKELGKILGFSFVSVLSPEKHDEVVGFLSQLTHCIAVSLMTCRDMQGMAEYSGDSFRDLTRIAKINDVMWSELFLENRDKLLSQMDLFKSSYDNLYDLIKSGEREKIQELMRLSTKERVLFDKTKGE
ncbi:MAG: prephenate dehydrogenase [Clostridia bacterium]|nr:prephenate dehydrogenase [Clostridia bacterium]